MINAFYSGTEGLIAQQTAMNGISNNIANISTTGFKSKYAQFSDVLYSTMDSPGLLENSNMLVGNGVALASEENDMSSGAPAATGNSSDYCVNANGFFAVSDAQGNNYYTRNGSFSAISGPDGTFLENSQGMYVLDSTGSRISVNQNGSLSAQPGVYDFSNSQGLIDSGGSLFTQSPVSGTPVVSNEGFKQGYLEGSNVDLAEQMTDMIEMQRSFQMSSNVVQTADKIASIANDLKE